MRTENSIKNAIVSVILNLVSIIIGFVAQRIFIKILGTEYLGINGLFSNVLSMLSIVELGIGSAIIYNLYKPIAEKDEEKVKSLMQFYKVSYRYIALAITIIGILIIPFLKRIVGDVNIPENIILIYALFLIDIIASYLLTYKRSILYANQKTYIINIVHICYLIVMNAFQLIILSITHNYILYLIVKILFRILENIVITIIANKKYPYIKDKNIKLLEKETKKNILTKVKGLVYHKIGGFIVLGSDNIIISYFLGVETVGLYSNYHLIIQAINNLFTQVFNSLTATIGNLLIENDKEKSYGVYKSMLFLNSWIFAFGCSGLSCIMEPFITVWIGTEFILPFEVLIVLVINFYIQGMRRTNNTFKEAAGIFYEDRFVPIMESVVNIIASVILVKIFGLLGVFLGTIISTFILFFYSYPKFVYMPLFNKNYRNYIKDFMTYLIVAFISTFLSYLAISYIHISNVYIQIIINLILVCIIPNFIHILFFYKTKEFKYCKSIIMNLLNKLKKNKNYIIKEK